MSNYKLCVGKDGKTRRIIRHVSGCGLPMADKPEHRTGGAICRCYDVTGEQAEQLTASLMAPQCVSAECLYAQGRWSPETGFDPLIATGLSDRFGEWVPLGFGSWYRAACPPQE